MPIERAISSNDGSVRRPVRGTHSSLVGCGLFVPEEWTADNPRCLKVGIPEEQIKPRSKTEYFSDLIDQALGQAMTAR
jgi:hypothetical protein